MSIEPARLVELAARIADGSPVSWEEEADAAASPIERLALRRLRRLAAIAKYHGVGNGVEGSLAGLPSAKTNAQEASWGRLRLVECIGKGAVGEVWLARDPVLERCVALKLLRPKREDRTRCLNEGRRLAKLRHPGVVAVYGVEEHERQVGIWMELVDGLTLEDILQEYGSFSGREAALAGIEICRALAAVHRAGLVHGDVKASNVMRAEGGRIVIVDFGSCALRAAGEDGESRTVEGTPLYVAPECIAGQAPTSRSDIYSLGVLLFHIVTGRFPVEGQTLGELRERHRLGERTLIRDLRDDLPDGFVRTVDRALSRDLQVRYATAGEMERDLAVVVVGDRLSLSSEIRLRERPRIHAPASLAVVIAIAGVVIVAVAVILLTVLLAR